MITTVTLNPMLDKTVWLKRIAVGEITRAERVSSIVGGKGVNVARQLHRLGCPAQATGVWGGEVGAQLDRLLTVEGVRHHFVPICGMTREGVTYLDAEGVMTCVFEPPHAITPGEVDALRAQCRSLLSGSSWLACCGSSPAPASDHVYADLVREARECGVRSAVDTYGLPLGFALEASPDVVKVNRGEYQNTIGVSLDLEHHVVNALITLVEQGVGLAILTDGPRPSYAASLSGCWKISPPPVAVVNPTGSGDSMLAGILYGLSRGWDEPKSISFGAAAGAANAAVWDVSAVTMEEIVAILPAVSVIELDVS